MTLRIAHADAATETGPVRPRNEDSLVARPELGLWAVADGAGGHGAGDVASQAVAAALLALPAVMPAADLPTLLHHTLQAVNTSLYGQGQASGRIIATTVVALVLGAAGCHLAWAGDSRAYLLRDGRLQQLTRDHSLVQELLDSGEITAEQAASHPQGNVILRAVGAEALLELDRITCPLRPGDLLLLCSDGLYRTLDETELASLLAAGAGATGLVAAALARRARDNVTAVVLQLSA